VRFRPPSRFAAPQPAEAAPKKWEEGQALPGRPAYPLLWPILRLEEARSGLPGRVGGRGSAKRMNNPNSEKSASKTSQKEKLLSAASGFLRTARLATSPVKTKARKISPVRRARERAAKTEPRKILASKTRTSRKTGITWAATSKNSKPSGRFTRRSIGLCADAGASRDHWLSGFAAPRSTLAAATRYVANGCLLDPPSGLPHGGEYGREARPTRVVP
jgi:hypothetical protein